MNADHHVCVHLYFTPTLLDGNAMSYRNLSADEVKAKIDGGEPFRLIDVREPQEFAIAQIAGAELLPLSRAEEWIPTLRPDEEIVFFCHSGFRSQ